MKKKHAITALLVLLVCSSATSAQEWVSWKSNPAQQPPPQPSPSTTQEQSEVKVHAPAPTPTHAPAPPQVQPSTSRMDHASIKKAECDAEVAIAYPAHIWAAGLNQKRRELFDACMIRGTSQDSATVASINKAECDAEVGRVYPAHIWAPGLGKKRKELFAACMAKRGAQAPVDD